MTAAARTQTNDWNFDFTASPTQDTELLQSLSFVPGLKEMLMVRQVHALEHATVWVLGEGDEDATSDRIGGLSSDRGFYLYGEVSLADLKKAVPKALQRLTSGDWDLAVHPRCGTNLSVGMLLTASLAIGAHLLLPREPIGQIIGLGIAATTAVQLAPDVGSLAQRYLTTAIPFNLAIEDITEVSDIWGREAHFVQVRWIE